MFCKYIECEWNKWDQQNLKHRCNKIIIHLNKRGRCKIGDFARKIQTKPDVEKVNTIKEVE